MADRRSAASSVSDSAHMSRRYLSFPWYPPMMYRSDPSSTRPQDARAVRRTETLLRAALPWC